MQTLQTLLLDSAPSIEIRVEDIGALQNSSAGFKTRGIAPQASFPTIDLERFTNRSFGIKTDRPKEIWPSADIKFVELFRTRMSLAHARKAALASLEAAEAARAQANVRDSAIAAAVNDDLFGG